VLTDPRAESPKVAEDDGEGVNMSGLRPEDWES